MREKRVGDKLLPGQGVQRSSQAKDKVRRYGLCNLMGILVKVITAESLRAAAGCHIVEAARKTWSGLLDRKKEREKEVSPSDNGMS